MKDLKEMNFLEKAGVYVLVGPIALVILIPLQIFLILYDAVIFQAIWNMIVPKLFVLGTLNLFQSIAINILISYQKISGYKETRKLDFKIMIIAPAIALLIAWVFSLFIK